MGNERGATLAEVLIATMIMGIVTIGAATSFKLITQNTQSSKARTLATNLAQEKIQILKQQSYHRIYVTSNTATDNTTGSAILYDTGYYPPDNILEGGINFRRVTYVEIVREIGSTLVPFAYTTPDTGMKQITVSVIWQQGSEYRSLQTRNVASNPDIVTSDAIFSGTVTNSTTGTGIPNAQVTVAENVGWQDATDLLGNYSMGVSEGNFNLVASAPGYFSSMRAVAITGGSTSDQDFALAPMSSGTVRGTVWLNNHLVISQVVASSAAGAGYQEYVELYNPTTYYVPIVMGMNAAVVQLKVHRPGDVLRTITMDYAVMNASVPPNAYYLMASVSPITVSGVTRVADATYRNSNPDYPDIMRTLFVTPAGSGSIGIADSSSGAWIDVIGFNKGGAQPNSEYFEGTAMNESGGFDEGEQFLRRTSTEGWTNGMGHAYDSNNNSTDFYSFDSLVSAPPISVPPKNSLTTEVPIAGTPAAGAVATASDGLSSPATAALTGNPPYAAFSLTSVATGTYAVVITSNSAFTLIDNVTVNDSAITLIPNAATDPVWAYAGNSSIFLTQQASFGFVSGRATDVLGNVISPAISVGDGMTSFSVTGSGSYFLTTSTGTVTVTANPGNLNSSYISQAQDVSVNLGQITSDVDFMLSQGGQFRGFASRGASTALPGIGFVALDENGSARGTAVSGSDGRFLIINLTTGTYTIEPVLDSGETSSPTSSTNTVTAGASVHVGTFTISGAYGSVAGNVTVGGAAIKTGVLVVVSTATISGTTAPALSTSTLTGAPYYTGSSLEDGTYTIPVRGSAETYRIVGYYPRFSGTTVTFSSRTVTGITVNAGATTSGVDLSW